VGYVFPWLLGQKDHSGDNMITPWFPTSILYEAFGDKLDYKYLVSNAYRIKDEHPQTATDWQCETYTSMGAYDLAADQDFIPILFNGNAMASTLARHYGIKNPNLICTGAWINVTPPKSNQEFHVHPNSHLSVVIYLKAEKECGNLVFKAVGSDFDMFELPVDEENPFNYKSCTYEVVPGAGLAFRSNIPHATLPNNSGVDRISIAMNFVVQK